MCHTGFLSILLVLTHLFLTGPLEGAPLLSPLHKEGNRGRGKRSFLHALLTRNCFRFIVIGWKVAISGEFFWNDPAGTPHKEIHMFFSDHPDRKRESIQWGRYP